jgi:hypothetical protein
LDELETGNKKTRSTLQISHAPIVPIYKNNFLNRDFIYVLCTYLVSKFYSDPVVASSNMPLLLDTVVSPRQTAIYM